MIALMDDEPDRAADELDNCMMGWQARHLVLQPWIALLGRARIHLYAGRARLAWQMLTDSSWAVRRWYLTISIPYIYIESVHHRARATLALAATEPMPRERQSALLRSVMRDVRRIERRNTEWGNALALMLRAGVASALEEHSKALHLLSEAELVLEALNMNLYATAARRARGILTPGAAGSRLVESAEAFMKEQRIRNPARIAAMLAPGFSI